MSEHPQTELLNSERQFSGEVNQLPRYTIEEYDTLIKRARNGDKEAREKFALTFMGYVLGTARKYANKQWGYHSSPVEPLDLVSLASIAILENMDKALEHPRPISYLRVVINGTILNFLKTRKGLITIPRSQDNSNPPIETVSLEAPQCMEDDDTCTLKDLIRAEEPLPSEEKDYAPLYQALDTLTELQRDVMMHLFGLDGRASETRTEYRRRTGRMASTGTVAFAKTKLRKMLDPVYAYA